MFVLEHISLKRQEKGAWLQEKNETSNGRKVLRRRRLKGRKVLSA